MTTGATDPEEDALWQAKVEAATRYETLQAELQTIAGPKVKVTADGGAFKPSPPSPLREDVLGAYTRSIRSSAQKRFTAVGRLVRK